MHLKSISMRISLNVILIVTLLSIVVLTVVSVSSHRIVVQESKRAARNMLEATIKGIEKDLSEVEVATGNMAWWAYANLNSDRRLYTLTQRMVEYNQHIVGCAIALREGLHGGDKWFSPYSYEDAATGEVISKQLGNDNYDYYSMEWYSSVASDLKPHWSAPYFDEGGGQQLMVTYSVPIVDTLGNFLGAVTADLSLLWLQEKMESIKPFPGCTASLVNEQQVFLATTINTDFSQATDRVKEEVKKNRKLQELGDAIREGRDSMMDMDLNGEAAFVVFGPLHNRWAASISFKYKDILSHASKLNLIIALVGLFGLLLMFAFCYFSILRLTKPITKLSDVAMTMSTGNFDVALPTIDTDDEVQRLRNSFDYMQRSLKNYISELKTTTATNERMESELNIARNIQSALLVRDFPKGVSTDNEGHELLHYDIHALLEPAKQVGGDLYDYRIKGDTLYFAVGDVSGKGVPAALVMGITRASLRFISGLGLTMAEVAGRVNNIVAEGNDTGMFVTLFCGRINLKTGECQYCNAGHNPIVVKPADAPAYFLKAKPNIAIGLFADFSYVGESIQLHPGDRLLFYTDGITEAERADKSLFGDDRLLSWANSSKAFINGTSQEAVNDLFDTVKAFTEGNQQNDDITIMQIKL